MPPTKTHSKRTKDKDRCLRIDFPTLSNQTLDVVVTRDLPSSWIKFFEEPFPDALAGHRDCGEGHGILLLPKDVDVATVAHECVHAVFSLFRYVGMELDDEAVAQHLSYLMEQVLEFLYRKK